MPTPTSILKGKGLLGYPHYTQVTTWNFFHPCGSCQFGSSKQGPYAWLVASAFNVCSPPPKPISQTVFPYTSIWRNDSCERLQDNFVEVSFIPVTSSLLPFCVCVCRRTRGCPGGIEVRGEPCRKCWAGLSQPTLLTATRVTGCLAFYKDSEDTSGPQPLEEVP